MGLYKLRLDYHPISDGGREGALGESGLKAGGIWNDYHRTPKGFTVNALPQAASLLTFLSEQESKAPGRDRK